VADDSCVVNLSRQEIMQIEMIVMDGDREEALNFIRRLKSKIDLSLNNSMKNHIDI
jgi:hypothetical protein